MASQSRLCNSSEYSTVRDNPVGNAWVGGGRRENGRPCILGILKLSAYTA